MRQVDHNLLEQCVPIVRRDMAGHQLVFCNGMIKYFLQPNQLTLDKVEDKDFWRALPVRAREGSCLARVDHPQPAKRVNLLSQL